ncbi:MAG: hypothetical protein JHD32_14220 [Sphingobium sp.]|nr:hypothetical protein [Sphingobium sp.]
MATMSIGKAWQEAVAFVAREATLLFPVALLFVALPGLILQEMTPPELAAWSLAPTASTMPAVPASYWLGLIVAVLLVWFGSLTLFALALRPGISVGEALRLGFHRLPVLIGTALAVIGALMVVVLAVVIVMVLLSLVSKALAAGLAVLLGFAVAGVALFASIRLMLLNPVVIDGSAGVMPSLRQAWALTRGHFWRLLAFILIITILSAITSAAAQAIFGLLGSVIGGADVARLAGSVAGAAISTVLQVYMLVMIARLYRQASAA